jgi:hypothetical protein
MKKIKKRQNHLIVGAGEVGQGIFKVLSPHYNVFIRDAEDSDCGIKKFDVMHICFPYSNNFIKFSKEYIKKYRPGLVINHSTVPIGTTSKIAKNTVHSPIRGVHPNLEKGIKIFVKYFGGQRAKEAAEIFERIGIKTYIVQKSEWTEAGKLWDTTQYGYFIVLNKEIWQWCQKNKMPFDLVYSHFNQTYNDGYAKLNRREVLRPYLNHVKGKIGGHCVIPNCHLLKSDTAKMIIRKNRRLN